jgi:DNA-binding beta-propeller fold protein YncE
MRMRRLAGCGLGLLLVTTFIAPGASKKAAARFEVDAIALPGAPAGGVALDYLAVDRSRHRVWVPAGGTGNAVVIDAKSRKVDLVEKFPTAEVERQGKKRIIGPSSATVGDGFVYIGNRADLAVCAVNAATLERGGCVTLPNSPDGVVFIPRTKEVWVTLPRVQTIAVLDVATPSAPKLAGTFKLDGDPEGYAVDDAHGLFYTNLEDKDRTLGIDVATRRVTTTWMPLCGDDGPRGLALDPAGQFLMVACTQHVAVLSCGAEGRIVSTLDTGGGVDNLDFLPGPRLLYAAAGGAGTLTVAHLNAKGGLRSTATVATAKGARNAVAADDGTVFVADGPEGKVLVVRTGS